MRVHQHFAVMTTILILWHFGVRCTSAMAGPQQHLYLVHLEPSPELIHTCPKVHLNHTSEQLGR